MVWGCIGLPPDGPDEEPASFVSPMVNSLNPKAQREQKVHYLAVGRGRCGTDTGYLVVRGLVVWALHRAVRVQASRPSKEAQCGLWYKDCAPSGECALPVPARAGFQPAKGGVRLRRTPFEHARKEKVDLTRGASSQHDPQLFIDEGRAKLPGRQEPQLSWERRRFFSRRT